MDDEKFLLAEYQYFSDAFWKNEETGEKRVEFFITLTTAVIAGIVALVTRSDESMPDVSIRNISVGALSAMLLFGLVTFLRIMQRNRVTDEFKEILDYLRELIKRQSPDLADYKLPFRSSKRWLKGGLAETVALMNSIIIGVMAALYLGGGWNWILIPILFLFSFALQVRIAKNDRRSAKEEKKILPQTFRANVGAVIINTDGLVLAFERKKISDSWQCPQGGLDEGEEPRDAVLREIWEETGIEQSRLELLATIPRWLPYEFPEELRAGKKWRGQVQKWFLFRFTGTDDEITMGEGNEFKAWEWVSMQELLSRVVPFKQPVYQELDVYLREHLNVK